MQNRKFLDVQEQTAYEHLEAARRLNPDLFKPVDQGDIVFAARQIVRNPDGSLNQDLLDEFINKLVE